MENLFKPIHLHVKDKIRNLNIEAQGEVKGTKYFPVFLKDGEEHIFKPVSKTKPYATYFFAFAEVYWSYLTKKFFDPKTPQYLLAYATCLENEQPKYYDYGSLVPSTINEKQKLINLLEIFRLYPEPGVDIDKYINYCMEFYDYTDILNSNFFRQNPELSKSLAWQILLSLLRQDNNYHYENVNFIMEDGKIIGINPPIDFEFSGMFLFPDDEARHQEYYFQHLHMLRLITKQEHVIAKTFCDIYQDLSFIRQKPIRNIITIVSLYPDIVKCFLKQLEKFKQGVLELEINDIDNFIGPLNSDSWNVGHSRYKENDEDKAKEFEKIILLHEVDKDAIFKRIKLETLENANLLERILKIYLFLKESGVPDLLNFCLEDLMELLNSRSDNEALEIRRLLKKDQ